MLLEELVSEEERKIVLFSEWTTMTYLIARRLSEAGIGFVDIGATTEPLLKGFPHSFVRYAWCPRNCIFRG